MSDQDPSKLPKYMLARAVLARNNAAKDPSRVDIDDEIMPWSFDEASGLWISFNGHYSRYSPTATREHRERQQALTDQSAAAITAETMAKHEAWSRIRQWVLTRDMNTCQLCFREKTSALHIHHIMKRRDGGTDHLDNLITVCHRCHGAADHSLYDPDWDEMPTSRMIEQAVNT